jgi:hypothetical protein
MKKLSRLKLNKESIALLDKENQKFAVGGVSASITMECCVTSAACLTYITQGDCDIQSIGHDDGPYCWSKTDWGWCWCYGI